MKKLTIISMMIIWLLLTWCNKTQNNQEKQVNLQVKQTIQAQKTDQQEENNNKVDQITENNLQSETEQVKPKTESKNTIQSQQNLEQQEFKKWDQIVNSKSGLFFYKLNCKKLFKTRQTIKKCELAGLKEAGYSCLDKSYFGTDDINKIFNKQKFDLIEDATINKYKQMCKNQLEEIKKQQEEEQKRQNKIEQVQQQIKNFKLSDCSKLADKQKFELPPKEILNKLSLEERKNLLNEKQNFIKTCRIWVILRYKNWDCSLLKKYGLDKECERIKKELDFYRRIQQEQRQYGNFNLIRLLAPNLANQENIPSWFYKNY